MSNRALTWIAIIFVVIDVVALAYARTAYPSAVTPLRILFWLDALWLVSLITKDLR